MKSRFHLFCLIFALVLFSCASGPQAIPGGDDPSHTEVGNGTGSPTGTGTDSDSSNPATRPTPGFTELEMRPATSTTLPPPASFLKEISLIDTLIELDEARMFLGDLALQDGSSFLSPGPFVVRLVRDGIIQDESFPAFGSHSVPQASYDQVNLGLKILTNDQIPPELQDDPLVTGALVNHSIVVEGKFKGPLLAPILGQLISFRFVSHQTDGLRIETPNPLLLNADQETLFIAFKVKTWLDLNLLNLLQNLNLAQLIDALVNGLNLDTQSSDPLLKGIALQIEANIDASLRLALSQDSLFDEGEVDETSFSLVFP